MNFSTLPHLTPGPPPLRTMSIPSRLASALTQASAILLFRAASAAVTHSTQSSVQSAGGCGGDDVADPAGVSNTRRRRPRSGSLRLGSPITACLGCRRPLAMVLLEYFGRAMGWMADRPEVDPRRMFLIGAPGARTRSFSLPWPSRDRPASVVALVPGNVVQAGKRRSRSRPYDESDVSISHPIRRLKPAGRGTATRSRRAPVALRLGRHRRHPDGDHQMSRGVLNQDVAPTLSHS